MQGATPCSAAVDKKRAYCQGENVYESVLEYIVVRANCTQLTIFSHLSPRYSAIRSYNVVGADMNLLARIYRNLMLGNLAKDLLNKIIVEYGRKVVAAKG